MEEQKLVKTLGCPGGEWMDPVILELARKSPRAALARLRGAIDAPFMASVYATFDATTDTIASGDLDAPVLGAEYWIKEVVFDIQVPTAYPGNILKTLNDFLYNKTSGIAARLVVTGKPRYDVATNYVPLSNMFDFIGKNWPFGWLLTKYNGIHMDFQPLSPLPFAPVTICATFRGYQYLCQGIDQMGLDQVFCELKERGYDVGYLRNCGDNYY
jgi:hypothetical protein